MKPFFIFLLASMLISNSAWAESLNCVVQEFNLGQSIEQTIDINLTPDPAIPTSDEDDQDPHSRMRFFNMKQFTKFEGFVAVVKETAVINVQTHDGSYGYSSTGNFVKGGMVSLQLLFPSEDENPSGILIQCNLKK